MGERPGDLLSVGSGAAVEVHPGREGGGGKQQEHLRAEGAARRVGSWGARRGGRPLSDGFTSIEMVYTARAGTSPDW